MVKSIGADAGNNGLKLWFDVDKHIYIPSVYALYVGSSISYYSQEGIALDELQNNIDVTITSTALPQKMRVIVGQKVIDDQMDAIEMELNSDKSTDEVPVITILSGLAIEAIRSNPGKEKITANYDISVALPIKVITPEKAKNNEKRFMGTHTVEFHLPNGESIEVTIVIEFAKCLAEGASAAWGITYDHEGKEVKRKAERYEEQHGKNVKIPYDITVDKVTQLHFDIGGGTTEKVVTKGVALQPTLSDGLNYGTKATILEMISRWNNLNPTKPIDSIAEFNEIYFNTEHPRHAAVFQAAEIHFQSLAIKLSKELINKMDQMKDEPFVFIYGGGALLVKNNLMKILESKGRHQNVFFLEDPMYVNAKGLYVYTCSKRFEQLKNNYLQALEV